MRGEDQQPSPLTSRLDPITGAFDRSATLATLFRETDRAQRMGTALSLLLFDLDDLSRHGLGTKACDEVLRTAVSSISRQLRSYDLVGRMNEFEFLVILPGCGLADAALLAERLHDRIFANPLPIAGGAVQLHAYFGVVSCRGRSPVVVLRQAEQAVQGAKKAGPGTIVCHGHAFHSLMDSTVPERDYLEIASSASSPSSGTPRNS